MLSEDRRTSSTATFMASKLGHFKEELGFEKSRRRRYRDTGQVRESSPHLLKSLPGPKPILPEDDSSSQKTSSQVGVSRNCHPPGISHGND
jgi:hypothetical protein